MSLRARLLRHGVQALGLVLTLLVLWLVGWRDRVVDAGGKRHYGRVLAVEENRARIEEGGEERWIAVRAPGDVRQGLATSFGRLIGRPRFAILALLLQLGASVVAILRWSILLHGAGLQTPRATVLRLGFVGMFFNYILPAGAVGGDLVKAWYATREHPERKTAAVVSVLADRGIGLFVITLIAAVAALLAPRGSEIAAVRWIAVAMLGGCVGFLSLLFLPALQRWLRLDRIVPRLWFGRVLHEIGRSFNAYGRAPRIVAAGAAVGLLVHAQALAAFWLYGLALGVEMPAVAVLVAIPVALMAASIPGLPGGWGMGNLAFYVALPAAGVPAVVAVALSCTFNAMQMLISLPGGLLLSRLPRRESAEAIASQMRV